MKFFVKVGSNVKTNYDDIFQTLKVAPFRAEIENNLILLYIHGSRVALPATDINIF